jgi:protease IV
MKKTFAVMSALVLFFGTAGCTLLKVSVGDEVQPFSEKVIAGEGRDKILLLDISGFISSSTERGSFFGTKKEPGLLSQVREQLDRARSDRSIKALLLRINSPGGGVTASDEIYHELMKFKNDTGVKVLAHIMDIGTSGAYYTALSADLITAQPTSVTGSIGVIMYSFEGTGLMQKIGLQAIEISSGAKKGMGSPFRPLAPEERAIFQNVIDSLQGRFMNTVSESRKLPLEMVKRLSDGRIYTSQEAQATGLIDSIGYLDDAIDQVKKLAHLEKASVVTYVRPGEYRPNLYSLNLINIDMGEVMGPGANFLYIWWP